MSISNLSKVALVDAKAPTTINTPVDMANPKCSCHCGCNNIVTFSGGNLFMTWLYGPFAKPRSRLGDDTDEKNRSN
ncbi:hypothetical protein F52700_11039 [Fusarium sp. NRRL 52700]|nr:hypothetical protein F52700_11039 [Fusarium sp. NRRL 52700]